MAEWPNVVTRTLSQWLNSNPFIPKGIRCIVSDEGRVKIGTGARFNDTPYLSQESILRKTHRNENARYFIPSHDEWHKAAYYDPNKGGVGVGGWWLYATQSDEAPAFAGDTPTGDGIPAEDGNSAAYGHVITWADLEGKGFLSVGTAGRDSAYGTFDQNGNTMEVSDGLGGGSLDDSTKFVSMGGSSEMNVQALGNYSPRYQFRYTPIQMENGYPFNGFRVATLDNPDGLNGFVDVGNAGNLADDVGPRDIEGLGFGAVDYEYKIGQHEVTNAQYCDFLNAVAGDDPYVLYLPNVITGGIWDGRWMGDGRFGGIRRKGNPGNYWYDLIPNFETKPVAFMSWARVARYCNWLHNGKPSGPQIAATTEDGAYTLNGTLTTSVARNSA